MNSEPYTIDHVLTRNEAVELVERADRAGFEEAPITIGPNRFQMRPDIRNNTRVMFDHVPLAALLFDRLRSNLPERAGDWALHGLNERFRIYRYAPGQRFAWHRDGSYRRHHDEESYYTLMVYLNEGFEGGRTEFADHPTVEPATGRALVFYHPLMHQGAAVVRGVKYVLRTDVMYRRER
jgi:predicted 2-oxoglutarate/Fe(II)-dependent dioxygenase YbiX